MTTIRYLSRYFWILIFVLGCTKEAEYIKPTDYGRDAVGIFDAFWNGIDQNYIFFDEQDLDWDKVYADYKPKAEKANTNEQLISIFREIFSKLIDGHRELIAPGVDTLSSLTSDYIVKHPPLDPFSTVFSNYLRTSITSNGDTLPVAITVEESPGNYDMLGSILATKNIGYLRVFKFGSGIQDASQAANLNEFISIVEDNTYGLILDLRYNFGGDARTFNQLTARFISEPYNWGYAASRVSRNRYELSDYIPQNITPNTTNYTKPVVVLIDRYSFSAAEISALALRQLPNVYVIGDTTGGATGPISDQVDYTGTFILPNNWKVQLAQRKIFDKNKTNYEGKGVAPDKVVKLLQSNLKSGVDTQMDAAIDYLSK